MLPSPAPRFYIAGAILNAAGAIVLALRANRGGPPKAHPLALLAVAAFSIAVGLTITAAGIWVDVQYNAELNTTHLSYRVSVAMNTSGPVRILLPAPVDERFFNALNVSSGSSSLRLNHTAAETNVVLTAYGNVSFDVQTRLPTRAVNWTFTRVSAMGLGSYGPISNVTVELPASPSDAAVRLTLDATIGAGCVAWSLSLQSWVVEGRRDYLAQTPTVVC